MEFFADNWPVILGVLGAALLVVGLLRRLLRLAIVGVVLGALGMAIWPMLPS